ncbi:hypothetical protein JTB14_035094 [Gonioctena quinquepunctata]|nr:hypothetical protein JTB14_035094 [Gonioctena quinquepunctata]
MINLPNQPAEESAPIARVYRGNPANQRDPTAKNTWRPRSAQPATGKPTKPSVPATLPPPTQLHNTAKVQMSTGSPSDGSVFATGVSTPAAIDISRQTYAELITDDPQLAKVLLPEYLDYYTTALIWLRLVHLKQRNSQALTVGARPSDISPDHLILRPRTHQPTIQ